MFLTLRQEQVIKEYPVPGKKHGREGETSGQNPIESQKIRRLEHENRRLTKLVDDLANRLTKLEVRSYLGTPSVDERFRREGSEHGTGDYEFPFGTRDEEGARDEEGVRDESLVEGTPHSASHRSRAPSRSKASFRQTQHVAEDPVTSPMKEGVRDESQVEGNGPVGSPPQTQHVSDDPIEVGDDPATSPINEGVRVELQDEGNLPLGSQPQSQHGAGHSDIPSEARPDPITSCVNESPPHNVGGRVSPHIEDKDETYAAEGVTTKQTTTYQRGRGRKGRGGVKRSTVVKKGKHHSNPDDEKLEAVVEGNIGGQMPSTTDCQTEQVKEVPFVGGANIDDKDRYDLRKMKDIRPSNAKTSSYTIFSLEK